MIEQSVIDKVVETANTRIVDIVSDFVSLKRRGVNYVGRCPFHNEKTGSFTVSAAKGFFKCFGCGKGGNALTFIMEHEHLTFVEAVRYLGNKLGISVPEVAATPEMERARSERESMMAVTEYAKKQFISNLWNTDDGKAYGLTYFRHRGFRDDIINKFELGYSLPQRDAFTKKALVDGCVQEFLVKTGLTITGENGYVADRFWSRVMFPIHSVSGKVIAFGGRVLQTDAKTAKYLNSPESELYHKSDIVYGIFQAKGEIIKQDRCYLVEGYTDVISMHQAGITNVVASSGTSLTTNQILLIKRFTNNITVLYDGDNAGIKASLRGIDMILSQGMNVKALLLPDGEDPDSFARSHTAQEYTEYIEAHQTDFIQFKTKLLLDDAQNDPLKKAALANDIVSSIAVVADRVLRTLYIKESSKLLEIDEETLFGALEDKLVKDAVRRRDEAFSQKQKEAEAQRRATAEAAAAAGGEQNIARKQKNPYANEEREVLRFFMKYVDKKLFVGTEEETTVGEYVVNQLAIDEMHSVDPVFNNIIQSYTDHADRNRLTPDFFINLADPQQNSLAVDLIGTEYVLSRLHKRFGTVTDETEMLDELVPRVINEVRMKKIVLTIEQLRNSLKTAEDNHAADDEIASIMNELTMWNEAKKRFSSTLGGRSVL